MALTNIRDISTPLGDIGAGFQFEFFCENCGDTWKTPFKPYRSGQAAGIFRRFGSLVNEFYKIGALTDMVYKLGRVSGTSVEVAGSKSKAAALEEAQAMAAQRYDRCTSCHSTVCANCYDESRRLCVKCVAVEDGTAAAQSAAASASASAVCPNCQTPSQGGRFCHECGFDMASTHKSCPACGVTMSRQARFCTDCGHGF